MVQGKPSLAAFLKMGVVTSR